jgi:hypothetical protein
MFQLTIHIRGSMTFSATLSSTGDSITMGLRERKTFTVPHL